MNRLKRIRCGTCEGKGAIVAQVLIVNASKPTYVNQQARTRHGLILPVNVEKEFGKVAILVAFLTSSNELSAGQEQLRKEEKHNASLWQLWQRTRLTWLQIVALGQKLFEMNMSLKRQQKQWLRSSYPEISFKQILFHENVYFPCIYSR